MSLAADLIKKFEGCRLHAYLDGGGVATIGYGQTGPAIHLGLTWTQDRADAALEHFLAAEESVLRSLIHVPVSENQFAALMSLAYNIGTAAFGGSTLLRKLNAWDYTGAAECFAAWNHDNGKVDAGLTSRRAAERAVFLRA